MAEIPDCQCDKPSRGGLTNEPCTRKVTQEDLLCDQCRAGCSSFSIGPPGRPEEMRLVDAHARAILYGSFGR